MNKKYTDERVGQKEFLESYLQRVDKNLSIKDVLADYNDGVINGNLLEFKLNINDLNYVLFQTIKILSSMRIKGKPIPKNIFLISLNTNDIYKYDSGEYIENIEKVYTMGASKDNSGFQGDSPIKKYNLKNELDESNFINDLKTNNYTKINIDDNCIVGWATRFYKENPSAKKSDFIGDQEGKVKIIGEIRNPNKFKNYINKYQGETNIKFQYLMDKLNDDLQKKILGAFYTPELYAKKSIELLREAIKKIPKGNDDYIILDRCAGTGNLEQYLTDEELSHTIVSTIEYYEYKVLMEVLGDKVRHIIPPTEKEDTFNMGLVRGADALSEEYINNPVIKQYIDNKKCTIIVFENPPYAETTSIEHQKKGKGKTNSVWKKSFVVEEMKKEVKGTVLNDLGNAFIWSAFKYYLRQDTDSYVVYSPVKYWKAQHLINKKFIDGFAFNRKHFHTNTNACIMCTLWSNKNENLEELEIKAFDIVEDENKNKILKDDGVLKIKRVYTMFSEKYYDKDRNYDDQRDGIACQLDGKEKQEEEKIRVQKLYNKNIIGYLVVNQYGFDNARLNCGMTRVGRYDGNGFFLRSDNYLEKLPMFVAGKYTDNYNNWTIMSQVMKSGDKAKEFERDIKNGKLNEWLLKCLFWTSLTNQSHMRSLIGSDKRFYRNELCLDNTNGDTLASKDLKKMKMNDKEKEILKQWKKVLELAKAKEVKNYNKKFSYGLYQIEEELNTFHKDENSDKNIADHPELNGSINTLKIMLKKYYNSELTKNLFKYELLK